MKNIPINKIEIKNDKEFIKYYTKTHEFLEINEKKVINQIKVNNNIKQYKLISINQKKKLISLMNNFLLIMNKVIILLIIYLIIYFILLFIQKNLSKKIALRKLETISEIAITIKGKGKIGILSESFSSKPNELLINGEKQNKINNYVNNINDEINVITMKWYEPLTSCDSMFLGLTNIVKFDFSKFDTLKVEKMEFYVFWM